MLKPALTLAAALALATPVMAQEYTLRAVANSNENDEDFDGLQVFKSHVEAASNGAIAVEIFMGTQLCSNGAECLQGVADGSIDVYISTSDGAAGLFPYLQVLDLPYIMADDRVAERVLTGDFTRQLRDMTLEDSGGMLRLMTIGSLPQRAMEGYGEVLLSRALPRPDLAALPPVFAERGLSTEPFARSIDPTGAAVMPLIEADPIRQGTAPQQLLTDEQWLALQQICAG